MATLRIEFYPKGPLQDSGSRDPLYTVTLSVGVIPTPKYLQPVAPSAPNGELVAVFYAIDAPVYVDAGTDPDLAISRTLVNKGTQIAINLSSGDNIAAITAFDIPQQTDSVIGPITGVKTIQLDAIASPSRLFGVSCTSPGLVRIEFIDGSIMDFPVYIGFQSFPFLVRRVLSTGTTAIATFWGLL